MLRPLGFCFVAALVAARAVATATGPDRNRQPLKIFLMAGQSNTAGHGYLDKTDDADGRFRNGTLEWLVKTYPATYGKLKTTTDTNGSAWKPRHDVFVLYNRQSYNNTRPESNQQGPLVAGFGGSGNQPLVKGREMGPELGFGWTIGDALGNPSDDIDKSKNREPTILLLKAAWGGRNLAADFRPPSSGGTTGLWYEAMLDNIFVSLDRLEEWVPGYTPERGYEIMGLAWHQGWSDSWNATAVAEYESNLANLIRDVRKDLDIPNLLVTIGVSGMGGWEPEDHLRTKLANAQLAVANYPEFAGSVASVETRGFYRELSASPGDEKFHWHNNCESYWLVGSAMGDAMIDLMQKHSETHHKAYLVEIQ